MRSSRSVFIATLAVCLVLVAGTGPATEDAEINEKMSQDQLEAELSKIKDEVEKLRKEHDVVFEEGDKNKDGIMSPEEFYAVQLQDDAGLSQQELEEAFADHDTDGSGGLSLDEWRKPFEDTVEQMMRTSEYGDGDDAEHIAAQRAEFDSFDANNDQMLDATELEALAAKVNEEELPDADRKLTGAEVLEALDADLDQLVSFEEYVLDGQAMYGGEYEDMYGPETIPDDAYGDHDGLDDLSLDDIAGDGELLK